MTQLSEDKTYRTRDGSRTGIRVKRNGHGHTPWQEIDGIYCWSDEGRCVGGYVANRAGDLIEETTARDPQPFSYDACPVHEDGRRRAVTRDGREVVLFSDSVHGNQPLLGIIIVNEHAQATTWNKDGSCFGPNVVSGNDLLVPPPAKRVVWVNLYDGPEPERVVAIAYANEDVATVLAQPNRLGNRAYRIEID